MRRRIDCHSMGKQLDHRASCVVCSQARIRKLPFADKKPSIVSSSIAASRRAEHLLEQEGVAELTAVLTVRDLGICQAGGGQRSTTTRDLRPGKADARLSTIATMVKSRQCRQIDSTFSGCRRDVWFSCNGFLSKRTLRAGESCSPAKAQRDNMMPGRPV